MVVFKRKEERGKRKEEREKRKEKREKIYRTLFLTYLG